MAFYVIDGMDGVGKDSVADALVTLLESKGRRVSCYRHPSDSNLFGRISSDSLTRDGAVNEAVRSVTYLLDLLVSSIRKYGDDADDIIFVRYSMSALYLPRPLSKILFNLVSLILPTPEFGILIDVPADIAMQRITSRGERMEVYENYSKLMTLRLDMLHHAILRGWHILDNRGSHEDMLDRLRNIVL